MKQKWKIDILSKEVRYELGDFSPEDAEKIIQSLIRRANFYLEQNLIKRLVQDLAKETGQVRPIELQIVGAQLQTDEITTLKKYQELGDNAKSQLVDRYLAEVVHDCGADNKKVADYILQLLAGDREARPLKTRTELESDLRKLTNDAPNIEGQLNLILEILVGSGVIFLLPEVPDSRYQLVHDYLATLIREQQGITKLSEAIAEIERSKQENNRLLQENNQLLQENNQSLRRERNFAR